MNYDDPAKIEDLVHNPWDVAALLCLEQGSLRYTELHRAMAAWSDRYLSESKLTRTRHRLIRRRPIGVDPDDNGHTAYSITDAGRARLGQIRVLMQITPHLEPETATRDRTPPADQDPTTWDNQTARGDRRPSGSGGRRSIGAIAGTYLPPMPNNKTQQSGNLKPGKPRRKVRWPRTQPTVSGSLGARRAASSIGRAEDF